VTKSFILLLSILLASVACAQEISNDADPKTVNINNKISPGFYASLGLGRGYTNFSSSNFFNTDMSHDPRYVLAGRFALGYDIDEYFGVELAYTQFSPEKFANLNNTGWDGDVREQSYDFQTVIRLPLFADIYGVAKLGPAYQHVEQRLISNGPAGLQPPYTNNVDIWRPRFAVGLQTALAEYSGLALNFEYSLLPHDDEHNVPDTELYTIGVILHF
jgi:hypothetical protein